MFTGIIEEIGIVRKIENNTKSAVLTIQGQIIFQDLNIGDSIAVNGVCLTASGRDKNTFTADVMHETVQRSGLGNLKTGSPVNLERAMPVYGRFGGHIVSGHIDGMGTIIRITREDNAVWYAIQASEKIMRYIVEKGSIAIDGISLTVARIHTDHFYVSIIPHTAKETILSKKSVGESVNLENDVIGKYIEKMLNQTSGAQVIKAQSSISQSFLMEHGF